MVKKIRKSLGERKKVHRSSQNIIFVNFNHFLQKNDGSLTFEVLNKTFKNFALKPKHYYQKILPLSMIRKKSVFRVFPKFAQIRIKKYLNFLAIRIKICSPRNRHFIEHKWSKSIIRSVNPYPITFHFDWSSASHDGVLLLVLAPAGSEFGRVFCLFGHPRQCKLVDDQRVPNQCSISLWMGNRYQCVISVISVIWSLFGVINGWLVWSQWSVWFDQQNCFVFWVIMYEWSE